MSVPVITPTSGGPRRLQSERWLLVAATLVSLALQYIPGAQLALYPIRLFVTIIHESGHAAMTLLTGGAVTGMAIHPDGSGVTYSLGGLIFLIYMAGYLGATAFGALAMQMCRRSGNGKNALLFLSAITLVATGLWMRPWGDSMFGFFAGLAIGLALLLLSRRLTESVASFVTAFLAVQLCLNALVDIRILIFLTTSTHADNDAVFMAQAFGMTPWFWALLWAAGAGAILVLSLRSYWRNTR
jgi:hypothetical protein